MPDFSIYLRPAAIWAPFIIRLVLGIIFMAHGAQKLFGLFGGGGIGGTAQFLQSLNVPLPVFSAWAVALVEFLGGLFLVIGLFTRIISVLIILDMVVAIVLVHGKRGFFAGGGGFEYNLALIAMALSLVLSGPGAFAVFRSDKWPF
ncbi:MAG: DoxX family protein [Armatimonadota bacterium]